MPCWSFPSARWAGCVPRLDSLAVGHTGRCCCLPMSINPGWDGWVSNQSPNSGCGEFTAAERQAVMDKVAGWLLRVAETTHNISLAVTWVLTVLLRSSISALIGCIHPRSADTPMWLYKTDGSSARKCDTNLGIASVNSLSTCMHILALLMSFFCPR